MSSHTNHLYYLDSLDLFSSWLILLWFILAILAIVLLLKQLAIVYCFGFFFSLFDYFAPVFTESGRV